MRTVPERVAVGGTAESDGDYGAQRRRTEGEHLDGERTDWFEGGRRIVEARLLAVLMSYFGWV